MLCQAIIQNPINVIYHSKIVKEKNHHTYRKGTWQNLCIYLILKILSKLGIEGNILPLSPKGIYRSQQ